MKQRRNRWNFAAYMRTFACDRTAQSKGRIQQQKWLRPIPRLIICLIVEFELQRCLPDDATEDRIMVPLMVVVFYGDVTRDVR